MRRSSELGAQHQIYEKRLVIGECAIERRGDLGGRSTRTASTRGIG
jgi:hypothetical protein